MRLPRLKWPLGADDTIAVFGLLLISAGALLTWGAGVALLVLGVLLLVGYAVHGMGRATKG